MREIQDVLKKKAVSIQSDSDGHKTPDSWAREGAELARHAVYLGCELLKPREGSTEDVLQAPSEYAPAGGRTARVQLGTGGTRLADQLKALFP